MNIESCNYIKISLSKKQQHFQKLYKNKARGNT